MDTTVGLRGGCADMSSASEQAERASGLPERSLLDAGQVPVEDLAAFAERESRRPRPIYLAHKWFARRFGTAFRALLVGATTSVDTDFWAAYYGEADLTGIRVLDPFVGGGTSVVEALRLGASVTGVDVDPVACGSDQVPVPVEVAGAEVAAAVAKAMEGRT
jgi:putative DNA methylase